MAEWLGDTPWGALLGAALLIFWMVGAYNRLVDLRNRIAEAWAHVDDGLKKRGDAIVALVGTLRGPLAAEPGALDAWLAAEARLRAAAEALASRPVLAQPAAALVAAEQALAGPQSRVLALLEQQPGLRGDPAVAPQLAAITESTQRLAFARQLFNDAAQTYNAAARQFPTRLLTRLYGFGTAGRL